MLKSIHSGRTLRVAKSLARATAMGLDPEYASKGDVYDLAKLEGTIHRLTMTRGKAASIAKIKLKARKKFAKTREEHLARWASNYGGEGALDWKRDDNLIRRGKPNAPRPGSSKGKIGKTRVIGAKRVLNDLRFLISSLSELQRQHGKANFPALRNASKQIRIAATTKQN
mgnify:CR=1 FL=1